MGCQKSTGSSSVPPPPAIPDTKLLDAKGPGLHQVTAKMPDGEQLRYTISVPAGYDGKSPVPLVIALHYAGDVTPFYGRGMIEGFTATALRELNPIIVAPDALDGGDWQTAKNEKAVVWLTKSIMKTYAIDAKKVLLTGFSMGGKGTWYLGGRHQDLFTAAIPIAGAPDDVAAEWKIPIYVIHSSKDEILALEPTKKHVEELKAKGVKIEFKVLDDLTHYQVGRYARPLREAVPWLKEVWK
jgi:predicted peptidase